MSNSCTGRKGDVAAMLRVIRKSQTCITNEVAHERHLVAEFCRLLAPSTRSAVCEPSAEGSDGPAARPRRYVPAQIQGLSPRMRQTLQRLLAGDQEKEVAHRLGVSQNTIHVYVKALYRHYDVSSRGELLSKFVIPLAL